MVLNRWNTNSSTPTIFYTFVEDDMMKNLLMVLAVAVVFVSGIFPPAVACDVFSTSAVNCQVAVANHVQAVQVVQVPSVAYAQQIVQAVPYQTIVPVAVQHYGVQQSATVLSVQPVIRTQVVQQKVVKVQAVQQHAVQQKVVQVQAVHGHNNFVQVQAVRNVHGGVSASSVNRNGVSVAATGNKSVNIRDGFFGRTVVRAK